jgi:hypothetical protein
MTATLISSMFHLRRLSLEHWQDTLFVLVLATLFTGVFALASYLFIAP